MIVLVGGVTLILVTLNYGYIVFQEWPADFAYAGCCCCYDPTTGTCAACTTSTTCYTHAGMLDLSLSTEVVDSLMPANSEADGWAGTALVSQTTACVR